MVSQITVPLGNIYHRNPPISSHHYIYGISSFLHYFTPCKRKSYSLTERNDSLAQPRPGLLVEGKGLECSALSVHLILEIQLAAASVDVESVELDPHAPVAHDDLVAKVEEEHNGRTKVVLEEYFSIRSSSNGLEILLAGSSLRSVWGRNLPRAKCRRWRSGREC
jgi:hypothetical protein